MTKSFPKYITTVASFIIVLKKDAGKSESYCKFIELGLEQLARFQLTSTMIMEARQYTVRKKIVEKYS